MNSTHFISLIKSLFITFIFGLLYVFTCVIFSSDAVMGDASIQLLIGSILTFISCLVLNIVVLPVITLIDRKRMDIKSFKELLIRYMPIFSAPFLIAFTLFFFAEGADYEILMHVFIVMLVSYTNLYVYLSCVKSHPPPLSS
ncbi:MAG: hypothetical protein ABI723_00700 [Bacteroidia bacterium]